MARNTINWTELWIADKKSVISTMYGNLAADLACGYNPLGACVQRQKLEILSYEKDYADTLEKFKTMTDGQIAHWCYYDLLKRGVIE